MAFGEQLMLRRTTVMALSACLLVVVVAPSGTWAREGKPTKVEIGKRGKAATAFVEVPGRGSGTAFSVHPSGLFITNEHVVRGIETGDVTLVLDPTLTSQ